MKQNRNRFGATIAAVTIAAALMIAALPAPARADVERIREKALELQQKLNREAFDVWARAEKPGSQRIYKDFDFILAPSKVEEAAEAEGADPYAGRLKLFLIESIVRWSIATYRDDLQDFEATSTAEFDGVDTPSRELLRRLGATQKTSDRRKIYSSLGPFFDTALVFRTEILDRESKGYREFGFETFADFYAAREGLDLDAATAAAGRFLTETQALYDSLFTEMAGRYLGVEARKVRFYDLPYLTGGSFFEEGFPADERNRRLWGLYRDLGVDIKGQSNVGIDSTRRPAKNSDTEVFAVMTPGDVRVSVDPSGGIRDEGEVVLGVGLAEIFALSDRSEFEPAYLVNLEAQYALASIPRFVLDEPAWIEANWAGEGATRSEYLRWRAFSLLYEARLLAAQALLEADAYGDGGGADLQKRFRDLMGAATGARISSSDSKRALAFLTGMRAVSRFEGLLLAAAVRDHLRSAHGQRWYAEGAIGSFLTDLWKSGGDLTPADLSAAAGGAQPNPAALLSGIEKLLTAGGAR